MGGHLDIFDTWGFYAGAWIACACLAVVALAALFGLSAKRCGPSKWISPATLFLGPYFAFLVLSYARPYLSIQDVPSVQSAFYYGWAASLATVGLYVLGGLAFFAGYLALPAASRRHGWLWASLIRPQFEAFKVYLGSRKLPYFLLSVLLLWGIGMAANVAVLLQVRGIPLLRISIRETEDPKLTFLAELQPLIVLLAPYVTTLHSTLPAKFKRLLRLRYFFLLVAVSLLLLTLLGARNLPAKLGLALLFFWLLSPSGSPLVRSGARSLHRHAAKRKSLEALLILVIALFALIGIGGALSKVQIYQMPLQSLPGVVVGAPVADSIGNLYGLEVISNYSGMYGYFHGSLLYTTFLSYIPGRDEQYANYIVGQIMGYHGSAEQSISSTFNGPAYLDFGILGLIANSLFFGFLIAYGWEATKRSPRNLGALVLLLATAVLDITLGTYNIWTFFSIAILIGCVEYSRVP